MTYYFDIHPIDSEEIQEETEHFLFLQCTQEVLEGAGIIIPKRHISTPFEFNADEWADLQVAIALAKKKIDSAFNPDGYNLGWNVGSVAGQEVPHVHLHIIPRYSDEPMAGKGIRAHIKGKNNMRTKHAQSGRPDSTQ